MEGLENVEIAFARGHELDETDFIETEQLKKDFSRFHHRFGHFLKENKINVYIKRHKEKRRGTPLYFVRLQVHAHHYPLNAKAEGYGLITAVHAALEKIERQAQKSKEKFRPEK